MTKRVVVVRTGTANLASVLAGLERAGAHGELTRDAERVGAAEQVVLPGVGAFAAAMEALGDELTDALRERVAAGRPLLGVCLGLQLLCAQSEESPGVQGIGVIDATVGRFPAEVLVPQLGWNLVRPESGSVLLREGYAYYANSFRLETFPPGYTGATSDHGGRFVAALERGSLLACQFHPELSGRFGHDLLTRWLSA